MTRAVPATVEPEKTQSPELPRARALTAGGVTLRGYQGECLEEIRDAYTRGVRRQLVCLPTGTGKTVVFSQLPRLAEHCARLRQEIVVMHLAV